MSKVDHPVFGEIEYDLTWDGEWDITFLGEKKGIMLTIRGDNSGDFSEGQVEVFNKYKDNESRLLLEAEEAVFNYYLENYLDIREMIGEEDADEVAPHIDSKEQLKSLVEPTELLIRRVLNDGVRVVGLLFDCSWDTSHGLAVKFEDEHIVEVGNQDIVL